MRNLDDDCPICGWGPIGCDEEMTGCRESKRVEARSACHLKAAYLAAEKPVCQSCGRDIDPAGYWGLWLCERCLGSSGDRAEDRLPGDRMDATSL